MRSMVRVEIVNAMQSLRVFVVPKNRKRREIALENEQRENEQRRNTPNSGLQVFQQPRRQNLAYCVSAPDPLFLLF
jgi:hypothetical protein